MTSESAPHQTFLFADLAGFTALTEAHGDEAAADLVGEFVERARELLPEYEAEEVKGIGDALMLRSADASKAVELACCLAGQIGGRHAFPSLRIGVHTGSAVQRGDDWFGATVNLAARVAAAAAAGEVLVTRATRDAADGVDHEFRARGRQRFRNIAEPVEIFVVDHSSEAASNELAIDPVCRMAVDPARSEHRHAHRGREYVFCSEACAAAFAAKPERHRPRESSRSELRVSDRDRERGAAMLRQAYERGQLSLDELDERLARLYVARTREELNRLLDDLPRYRRARRAARTRAAWRGVFPFRRRRR